MILVIPYSSFDHTAALRLVKWCGFLSSKRDNEMLNEKVLLVASQRAERFPNHRWTCWLAARVFGEARCYVPETEYEKGWPASANWMFKVSLEHVERHFQDDIFWLEPDAIPTRASWWSEIKSEWGVAQSLGKNFMGAYVPHNRNHMTGVAVYGKDWRKIAPTLVQVPDHDAFDTYSSDQVIPNMHGTTLIQHVFRRHDRGWQVPSLSILDQRAAVFHQDKRGRLIRLLDDQYYNGDCRFHSLFGYDNLETIDKTMRKFYYAQNATRRFRSHDISFGFEQLQAFGGSVPGVYTTESEAEQVALSDLAMNPGTGIREIPQEEYEQVTKKKASPTRVAYLDALEHAASSRANANAKQKPCGSCGRSPVNW